MFSLPHFFCNCFTECSIKAAGKNEWEISNAICQEKRGVKKLHCKIFAIKIFHCIKLISQSDSRVCVSAFLCFFWVSTFHCMPFENKFKNAALIIHICVLHQTIQS